MDMCRDIQLSDSCLAKSASQTVNITIVKSFSIFKDWILQIVVTNSTYITG